MGDDLHDQTQLGERVFYRLSAKDAEQVNRRRTTGAEIARRMPLGAWPEGAQAHIGEPVHEGDLFPMMVTAVYDERHGFSDEIGGQVFLNGNDVLWVTHAKNGTAPGQWSWLRT